MATLLFLKKRKWILIWLRPHVSLLDARESVNSMHYFSSLKYFDIQSLFLDTRQLSLIPNRPLAFESCTINSFSSYKFINYKFINSIQRELIPASWGSSRTDRLSGTQCSSALEGHKSQGLCISCLEKIQSSIVNFRLS